MYEQWHDENWQTQGPCACVVLPQIGQRFAEHTFTKVNPTVLKKPHRSINLETQQTVAAGRGKGKLFFVAAHSTVCVVGSSPVGTSG